MRISALLSGSLLVLGSSLWGAPISVAPPAGALPEVEVPVVGESIDVRVVNVEAVVTDKAGRRVHGLAAGDFRLLVDGREVPTEYFSEIEDGRSVGASPAAPVAAGEEIARSYLVYVDDSYSLANRRDRVLDQLERDVALLGPVDRMAILAFDGAKIDVLSAWTGDRQRLRDALAQARLRPALGGKTLAAQRALGRDVNWVVDAAASISTGDSDRVGGPKVDEVEAILDFFEKRTSPEARTQSGKTVDSMAATLRSFEAPPGRKVMFLLTGAWQLSVAPWLYGPILEAANGQGYSVYPVDTAQSDATEVSAFDQLARVTGGRAIVAATSDAFRQVVADSGSFYWLGFSPNWKANDRRHAISVAVRRPGLQVRSRSGFSDRSRPSRVAAKAEGLLLFGGASAERRLLVELGEPKARGRRGHELDVPVTLGVPVEALALRPDGSGYRAEVPLAIAAEDEDHRRAELPRVHLEVKIDKLPAAGTYARFQTVLQLRNAQQRLVFTVQDPASGQPLWGEATLKPAT
jgi:VWFA-related protein